MLDPPKVETDKFLVVVVWHRVVRSKLLKNCWAVAATFVVYGNEVVEWSVGTAMTCKPDHNF